MATRRDGGRRAVAGQSESLESEASAEGVASDTANVLPPTGARVFHCEQRRRHLPLTSVAGSRANKVLRGPAPSAATRLACSSTYSRALWWQPAPGVAPLLGPGKNPRQNLKKAKWANLSLNTTHTEVMRMRTP